MNKYLLALLTAPCALAFGDGFAPIDYGPMEDYTEGGEKFVSCADEVVEADLLADKEYFPEPKGGSVELGTSALDLDSNPLPNQSQDQAIPNTAPDYFPSGGEESLPGAPNQPVPYTKPKPPLSPQPPSRPTPTPQDAATP